MNSSPHIKTSGPVNRLALFLTTCTLQLSYTTDTRLHRLLYFKTRTVTECDFLTTATIQKQTIKNSKFKIANYIAKLL